MKSRRIFTQIVLCGAIAWLVTSSAWANWGPPMSNGGNAYGPNTGYGPGADQGCVPSMMPYAGSGMDCAGPNGYGPPAMNYLPMDGGACVANKYDDFGNGPCLGGLASGCQPVGLLGRLGAVTGLGGCGAGNCGNANHGAGGCRVGDLGNFGCSKNGYNRGAYPRPFGPHQEPVNPYESHPGIGPMGDYINEGDVCCGPHWYDVMVEAVFLQRERDSSVGLVSEGPRGMGAPNLVLSTGDLDTGLNTGLRVAGRLQMNAVDSIEAVYLGGVDWSDTQTVISNFNDLYSVYSDFGVDPPGGFEDTDQAARDSASLNSDLDSIEINCRRDWTGPHYKMSGALLFGGRYVRFRDQFRFSTMVLEHVDDVTDPDDPVIFGPGASLYDVSAQNDMLGVQTGGELTFCLFPGFTLGAEGKIGVFGNSTSQETSFTATTGPTAFNESRSATIASYGTEVQAFFLWQFHPLAKLRGGYEALFLDGLATGPDNFNPQNVFLPRNPALVDDADLLFRGFNLGLELGW